MIFVLLLDDQDNHIFPCMIKIIKYSFIWGFGYIGMWVAKWIIGSIVLKENLLENAYKTILWRSSTTEYSRFDAIKVNFAVYKKKIYFLIFGGLLIYYFIRLLKYRKEMNCMNGIKKSIPFMILALMPCLWYFFASNHSHIHYWFTYRSLMIFFFSVMIVFEKILSSQKNND